MILSGTGRGKGKQHSGHYSVHSLRIACCRCRRARAPPSACEGGGLRTPVPAHSGPAACFSGSPEGPPVREGRAVLGPVRRHPGGRGHGPPELCCTAGPGGALGLSLHLRSQPWAGGEPGRGLS